MNISPFSPIETRSYDRPTARSRVTTTDDDRFYFGFDIGPYWFAPLARCFGLTEKDIEDRAATVVATDWNYSGRLRWEEDERSRRKIFKHEDSHHSSSSYPRVDELRFYLSFHAMMVVAGQLLANVPTYRSPDYAEDDFPNWLHSRHDLSRRDGYWLADRRDPVPLDTHVWKNKEKAGDSHSSIRRQDFDRVLFPSHGMVTLWGYWTSAAGREEEVCNIRSALVSPDQSRALLRALQSADDHHDYLIPDAEDDRQIDFGPFQLKGWIIDRTHDRGIDGQDPWAGGIGYPVPSPSREIIEAFNLMADREHRAWRQSQTGPIAVTTETWGTYREKDDDAKADRGDRVQASTQFVGELLRHFGMDMIVEVEIKWQRSYSRYESRNDDDSKPVPPSTRVFLIKADGRFRTI